MVDQVKKRRIFKKDWDEVAKFISTELKHRRATKWRRRMEPIWKEVDRQVAMEKMKRINKDKENQRSTWQAALELGELSRASEILTADINRNIFPVSRDWMAPHINIDWPTDPATGIKTIDPDIQKASDGRLRSLMAHQQADFGFVERQTLAIKEALHHGGYVAEAQMESLLHSTPEKGVKNVVAPAWVTHSMWHCYPENTASHTASNLFYNGSMIISSGMRFSQLMRQSGKGWIQSTLKDLEKPTQDKDIDIITWHGDINLQRKGGDVYLPNVVVKVAQNKVVYYLPNELPYSRIIYNGYERLDVRDPYYISPLVKMSPTQKLASIMANKFIDAVSLKNEPPITYDGNDPDLKQTGGPKMAPGSKTPMKGQNKVNAIDVGDPQAALAGLQFSMTELQKGTGVDANRSGLTSGTEQTATEVERTHQGGQIRTIDFVTKHEQQGLRPFLYLQHELNKIHLNKYTFYNPVVGFPDFDAMSKSDLIDKVHFEVVGSKGLQEERQREAEVMAVTKFLIEVGYNVNLDAVAKDMYQDAGKKDPEEYLIPSEGDELTQALTEMQQQLEEITAQAQQLAQENESLKTQEVSRIKDTEAKMQADENKAQLDAQNNELKAENEAQNNQLKAANDEQAILLKAENERIKIEREAQLAREKALLDERENDVDERGEMLSGNLETLIAEVSKVKETVKEASDNKEAVKNAVVSFLRKKDNPKLNTVLDEIEGAPS